MSDTMTEGVIVAWHKKTGDTVKSGDLLAEVETDKATMELESYQNGTLLYIGVEKGSTVPVDGILAVIGKPGEDFAALISAAPRSSRCPRCRNSPCRTTGSRCPRNRHHQNGRGDTDAPHERYHDGRRYRRLA